MKVAFSVLNSFIPYQMSIIIQVSVGHTYNNNSNNVHVNNCTFTNIVGHLVHVYDDLENILNNILTYIGPRKFFIRPLWLSWREGKPFIFVLGIWKESGMSGRASFRKRILGVEYLSLFLGGGGFYVFKSRSNFFF